LGGSAQTHCSRLICATGPTADREGVVVVATSFVKARQLGTQFAVLIPRPPGVWGQAVWDLSRWDDPTGGVTLDSERDVDLLAAVKNTVGFLLAQGATPKTDRADALAQSETSPDTA
jgi:hypothetical protein